ncbi:hypothetical protein [Okeania sp. SIO2C2]|uniref:hypothetical protein n=1 Tax=Okeania sp. SIO2C2 TaxID=2607787 RepID=UPI00257F4253|nr:hypothetical protein [Okeania sp. SIO2C2]
MGSLQKSKVKSILIKKLSITSPYCPLPIPYSLFSGNIYYRQIHQARQFPVKVGETVHSNVTAEPSTLAVSRNALRNIPKAPFPSLGIE